MTNERLRAAFWRAGLSPDGVASQLGVDPKSVQNWLGGRTPHRGLRWAVSQLVEESEHYLWPDATRAPGDDHGAKEEFFRRFLDARAWEQVGGATSLGKEIVRSTSSATPLASCRN